MKIIITNRIYIYHCSNSNIRNKLIDHLTIVNPLHAEAIKAGRRHFHIPQTLSMFNQHDKTVFSIPRGAESYLNYLLDKYDQNAKFDDRTYLEEPGIDFDCNIIPYDTQEAVIKAGLANNCGLIAIPTGLGKTVIALYLIAQRRQPTMILVHNKEIFYQWRDRAKEFLNYDTGMVGDGKFKIKDITIGLKQTVINRSKPNSLDSKFAKRFGFLIIDECHRVSSSTFTQAAQLFEPYYILGLSATPYRRDGLSKFINFTVGDIIFSQKKSEAVKQNKILKPTIIKRNTNLTLGDPEENYTYVELLSKLKNSEIRNQIIANDIKKLSEENFSCCLCLSDHETHIKKIQEQLDFLNVKYSVLTGKLSTGKRKGVVTELRKGNINVLLATTSLLSDGFDYDAFTSLSLMMPVSYEGRLEQILGRVIRTKKGKNKVLIYDYVDQNTVFQSQYRKRKKVYESY